MEEWPFISVVIVNYNGERWIKEFFKSVLESTYPKDKLEVIFVDDGSKDRSVEIIKNNFGNDPRVKILCFKENVGWARAVNYGIKHAQGEIIVHISSDVKVTPLWLIEAVRVLKSRKNVGIVQFNSISFYDKKSTDSGMNFLDKFGFSYGYMPEGKEPREVFFAEGLAFGIKKDVFREIGIFDEYYFMEYDDQDICWRARMKGYSVFFVPTAVVYHIRGASVGRTYFQRLLNVKFYTRNHLLTIIKNYEAKNIIKVLPIILIIDIAKCVYLIVKRKHQVAYAVLLGLLSTLRTMKVTLVRRREIQSIRTVSDKEIMQCMVPFNPWMLIKFYQSQERGKRFVSSAPFCLNKMRLH
jgi:hypothetical protein